MTSFENTLLQEIRRIREAFALRDASHIFIGIEAEGAPDHGELKVTFTVGEQAYGAVDRVTGSDLDSCMAEYFRRKGWKAANDYLALPNLAPPKAASREQADD